MTQHVVPRQVYYRVFAALLALTLLTVGAAHVDLGPLNIALALGIAICKALLVMLFFMHLRYSTHLTWIVAAAGVIWLGHLILFSMIDYLTRSWLAISSW
jgi:cytochrome c oxidase subunit IV